MNSSAQKSSVRSTVAAWIAGIYILFILAIATIVLIGLLENTSTSGFYILLLVFAGFPITLGIFLLISTIPDALQLHLFPGRGQFSLPLWLIFVLLLAGALFQAWVLWRIIRGPKKPTEPSGDPS
jgi:hypothetical protein